MPAPWKVIIVDDEPLVRKRLRTLINWEDEGFRVAGEGEDGEEGLNQVLSSHADLVITDIRMPVMGGLELVKKARENIPGLCCAILSGYDEFSYAREAMQLGVDHYLLKPVDPNELMSMLRKARCELERQTAIKVSITQADALRRAKWARDLMDGRVLQDTKETALYFGIDVDACQFGVIAIDIDYFGDPMDEERVVSLRKDAGAAILAIDINDVLLFPTDRGIWDYTVLCVVQNLNNSSSLAEISRRIMDAAAEATCRTVTIGVSNLTMDYAQVHTCAKDAITAVSGKSALGCGRVIHIDEIIGHMNRPTKISTKVLSLIQSKYMQDITLKSISSVLYMNPVYLGQVFKNETGVSFNDCLTSVRIGKAAELLADSDLPVDTVAEYVGYKTHGNFYKAFKKIRKRTPNEFRAMIRGET